MIPETTIQELKGTNLIDIIGQYVNLKRSNCQYVGLCPFHNEKTPSFFVHPKKGYYCHGCGAHGGNAIAFIMAIEKKTFVEAVERLAAMTGTVIGKDVPTIKRQIKPIQPQKPERVDYIPEELVSENLAAYKRNNLYKFLSSFIDENKAGEVCKCYGIGGCKYYGEGTTLFIQRDIDGNVRQAKVMLYDAVTGHRRKEKEFEPKIIGRFIDGMGKDVNLVQCFFNERLLSLPENEGKPVALVESEKTAAICSIYYPQFVWLAKGSKSGGCSWLNPDVNKVLKGRHLHLFPDVDGMDEWKKAAGELRQQSFQVFINDKMASYPELAGTKMDIADLLADVPRKPDNTLPDWQLLNQKMDMD